MMRSDKAQALSAMTTRQKVTIGVFILVVIVVVWQLIGLFSSGSSKTSPVMKNKTSANMMNSNTPGDMSPQPAQLPKHEAPISPREAQLMQLQQETQAKYLTALNELQMLRVTREIAETNQAIATAKLATVTAEKGIVDMLAPPGPVSTPGSYAKGLINPTAANSVAPAPQAVSQNQAQPGEGVAETGYTVISVSQLQYKWSAVLGYKGTLYNVSVGDVLPADGSKVISIDKSGVILEKDKVKKKISLVPII